jgi:hypothetical protein
MLIAHAEARIRFNKLMFREEIFGFHIPNIPGNLKTVYLLDKGQQGAELTCGRDFHRLDLTPDTIDQTEI